MLSATMVLETVTPADCDWYHRQGLFDIEIDGDDMIAIFWHPDGRYAWVARLI